jgi:hypothetical protein
MLADTIDAYRQQEQKLISDFRTRFGFHLTDHCLNEVDGVVHWVARCHQRKCVMCLSFFALSNLMFPFFCCP